MVAPSCGAFYGAHAPRNKDLTSNLLSPGCYMSETFLVVVLIRLRLMDGPGVME
jgi:hypothetical protein